MRPMTRTCFGSRQPRVGRKVGRPRVGASPEDVRGLREHQRMSWRQIAAALKIGTATAIRLYATDSEGAEASQNSPTEVPRAGGSKVRLREARQAQADGTGKRVVPVEGRSPGRCPHCNSTAWRLMPCGPVCSAC